MKKLLITSVVFLGVFAGVQEAQAGAAPSGGCGHYVTREDYASIKKSWEEADAATQARIDGIISDIAGIKTSIGDLDFSNAQNILNRCTTEGCVNSVTGALKDLDLAIGNVDDLMDTNYARGRNVVASIVKLDRQVAQNTNDINTLQGDVAHAQNTADQALAEAGQAGQAATQAAGSAGQAATSAGQAAGSAADAAESARQAAGSAGQAAGSAGQAATSAGQAAGSAADAAESARQAAGSAADAANSATQAAQSAQTALDGANRAETAAQQAEQTAGGAYALANEANNRSLENKDDIASLQGQVNSLVGNGEEGSGVIGTITTNITNITNTLNETNETVANINNQVESHNTRISSVETSVANHDTRISNVETSIGNVNTLADAHYAGGNTIMAKCGEGEKCIGAEPILQPTVVDTILNIDRQTAVNTQNIETLNSNVNEIASVVDTHTSQIETLAQNDQVLSSRIDETNATVAEIAGVVDTHSSQIQTLSDNDQVLAGLIADNADAIQQNTQYINEVSDVAWSAHQAAAALAEDVGNVNALADAHYVGGMTATRVADDFENGVSQEETVVVHPTVVDTVMNLDGQVYQNTQDIATLAANDGVLAEGIAANAEGIKQNAQNIDQLYANDEALQGNIEMLGEKMNQMASNTSGSISALNNKVNKLDKKVKTGFASNAALSALVPNARAIGNTQLSAGTGYYDGEFGGAVGVFHYFNDNVLLNAGVSYAGDESLMARAGVSFGF